MATTHIVKVFQTGAMSRVDWIDTERDVVPTLVDYLRRENPVAREILETPYGQVTEKERSALSAYENTIRTRIKVYPTAAVHCDEDGTLTIATKG